MATFCPSISKFGRMSDACAFSPTSVAKTHAQKRSAQNTKTRKNCAKGQLPSTAESMLAHPVIPCSNTLSYPWTVMVVLQYALCEEI